MAHPAGERRPLRQLRREIWALRRYERKNPADVGEALRDHVLYGDNSPYLRHHGPRGARRLKPRHLLEAWQEVQRHALEVGYVGREEPEKIAAALRRLPLAKERAPATPHVVYRRSAPPQTTVYFLPRRDAVQTQLYFAVEGDAVPAAEQPAADAFSEYIGGSMAGLVFQEVREYRALAYSARAQFERDEDPTQRGHLIGHVACQADKSFDVLDVMTSLIGAMPERRDRLGLVRSALVRSQETESPSFRELQQKLREWQLRGHQDDPRRALVPAYDALEFDDIVAFYRRHVAGRPLAIMVVGDPRKVTTEKLAKYGKVVRLREHRLYGK